MTDWIKVGTNDFFCAYPPSTLFLVDVIYGKTLRNKILIFPAQSAFCGHFLSRYLQMGQKMQKIAISREPLVVLGWLNPLYLQNTPLDNGVMYFQWQFLTYILNLPCFGGKSGSKWRSKLVKMYASPKKYSMNVIFGANVTLGIEEIWT